MINKIKSITITKPANDCKDGDVPTLEQMVQDALYGVAYSMKQELEEPQTNMLWPRKWHIAIGNGDNELVMSRLDVYKFPDIRKSKKEIGELFGTDGDATDITLEKKNGATKSFPLDSSQFIFYDLGEGIVEEEVGEEADITKSVKK